VLQERIAPVHRMQEIVYDESPYIPLVVVLLLRRGGRVETEG